jgi:hypothetical protein
MRPAIVTLAFLFVLEQASAQLSEDSRLSVVQEAMTGRISCNDPRILSLFQRTTTPGVSLKDFNFIDCVARRIIKANRIRLPEGFGRT